MAGMVVVSYEDRAEGTMEESPEGDGRFVRVTLRPHVRINGSSRAAKAIHQRAHELCFIANSVNFPVHHEAVIEEAILPRRSKRDGTFARYHSYRGSTFGVEERGANGRQREQSDSLIPQLSARNILVRQTGVNPLLNLRFNLSLLHSSRQVFPHFTR